ncbi:MAG: hypothetical protein U0168_28960 [Nannocystaceae bacterium]
MSEPTVMRVPNPCSPASSVARAAIPALALLLGCHGGGGAGPDEAETGFLSESLEDDGEDDGPETWGDGELRGIVTFTLYAADSVTDVDQVGFAGAWHDDEAMVEVVDDFYAAFAFQTAFPLPPQTEDEVEQNDIPAGFDWGDVESWLTAGNAFALEAGDAQAYACLLQIGMVGDIYPVYAASHSAMSAQECAPQPEDFIPGVDYTIVMYGGELFPTQTFLGAVETPADFDVLAPDLSGYNDPVMQGANWRVQWEGEGTAADRLIIRVWDDLGFMFTVRAADDGEFEIPASALAELNPGPITITIAREHIERIPFTEGGVKVVTRYEQRGYFDLIAAG